MIASGVSIEFVWTVIQGILAFFLAYFAYDFLQEFKALRKEVGALHLSFVTIVSKIENVESDHGRRLTKLEDKVL